MRLSVLSFLFLTISVAASLPSPVAAQEPVTLSGRVLAGGNPIGYAEVIIPSLGLGASTREDGRYAIGIPSARATPCQTLTVTARRLGYKPTTLQVTLSAGVIEKDFSLLPNPLQLGQIVVTRAGTVVTNRAMDLIPNDIESVEILKGAASGAIYGARAGQGVILITTKSGHPGATHFTLRSSASFDNVNHFVGLQTKFGQGRFGVEADTSVGGACDDPGNSICRRSWGPALPAGTPVFDHSHELYETGHVVENALTISGGNYRTTFYLSGENLDNNGMFVGDHDRFNRNTIRVKGSHRWSDQLRIDANLAYADTRGHYIQRGNNVNAVQIPALRTPPEFDNLPYLDPVFHQHRSYRFQHPTAGSLEADRGFDNPFFALNEQVNTSAVGRVFGNIGAEYLATSWLKIDYTLGADYANDERLEGCAISSSDVCNGGRVIEGKVVNYQIDHNLVGTAQYTVNPNVSGTITLGQNLNSQNNRNLFAVGRGLLAPTPYKLSNTVARDLPLDDEIVIHRESYFGQATIDLYQQVYLTASLRNNGFSNFGRLSRRGSFPKARAAC